MSNDGQEVIKVVNGQAYISVVAYGNTLARVARTHKAKRGTSRDLMESLVHEAAEYVYQEMAKSLMGIQDSVGNAGEIPDLDWLKSAIKDI